MTDHPSALVSVPVEPTEAMRAIPDRVVTEALYWMARAYERVHSMPRVSDTELANRIEAAKADLGRARDASPILSAPAAPQAAGVGELVADLNVLATCDDMEVSHSGGDTNVGDVARRCLNHLRAPSREPEGGAVAMIRALLGHIDRETCQHDNLKRGGVQWTICEDCDRKWADDQGGFKPYTDAPPVAAARLYLEALATREEAPAEAGGLPDGFLFWLESQALAARHYFDESERQREAVVFGERPPVSLILKSEAEMLERALSALRAQPPAREDAQPVWVDGVPTKHHAKEWFIAETTFGDRVVLTALPEEYTYDFKTADETYIKADRIKRWMPFPDSQYLFPHPAPDALRVAVEAFMPTNIDLTNTNLRDDQVLPCDVTVGELRAISAALQAEQGAK